MNREYKTYNIKFTDWYDKEKEYYEVAEDVAGALSKFYDEVKEDGGLTRILDVQVSNDPYVYWMVDEDGDLFEYRFATKSQLFNDLSELYAFDDCSPWFSVERIECEGKPVVYCGWMPGMRMQYRYYDGWEIVWDQCYPQWDH